MIDGRKVLGVIAARGGSKGLPGKNLADLGGRPLIAWSVIAAGNSKLVDRTVVSTDDKAIASAARAAGGDAPFLRPANLATDDAPMAGVLLHALDQAGGGYAYAVLLQATSPLRNADDIDGCVRLCHEAGAPSAVSVTATEKNPRWMFTLQHDRRLAPLSSWDDLQKRRQELPEAYAPNGAVYVVNIDWFRRERRFFGPGSAGYSMPRDRSVDIDTAFDLALARSLLL